MPRGRGLSSLPPGHVAPAGPTPFPHPPAPTPPAVHRPQDRARFINDFRAARAEMKQLIAQRSRKGAGGADICTIM